MIPLEPVSSCQRYVGSCEGVPGGCKARGTECARQESNDDQCLEALGATARREEDGEHGEGRPEHGASTKDFGARRPDERTDHKAEHEAGCD